VEERSSETLETPPPTDRKERSPPARERLGPGGEAVLAALALAALYLLLRTSPYLAIGAFHDDGVYLAVGKALADGEGYRSLYAVGEPVHAKYPPGLPALYALLWGFLPDLASVHRAALLLSLVTSSLAAGVLWWLARARMALSAPIALFFVVGPFLLEASVQYFNLAATEPYFILLWGVALVLFHALAARERRAESGGTSPATLAVLLGAVAAGAVLFRSQGIVLVPAIALAMLVPRVTRRSFALYASTAVLPVAAWRIWHRIALLEGPVGTQPDEGAYVSWTPSGTPPEMVRFIIDVFRSQVRMYGTYMPPHLSSVWSIGLGIWLLLLAVAVAGSLRSWRRHPDLVLTAWTSAAIVFLWPWWQDRFVVSLLPFLGLIAAVAVEDWMGVGSARRRRLTLGVLAVVSAVLAFRQVEIRRTVLTAEGARELFFHPAAYLPSNTRYLLAASRWMALNTPEGADVVAPHPVGIWLYTGRQVVNATPALPDVGPSVWDVPGRFLAQRVVEDDPDFLALWALNERFAQDVSVVQRACPEALEYLGFTREYTRVAFYRIHAEDPCFQERFLAAARAELEREEAERR